MADKTDTPRNSPAPAVGAGSQAYKAKSNLTRMIGIFSLGGVLTGIALGLGALVLARYGIISKIGGFRIFMMMLVPLAVLAGIAIIGIVLGIMRKRGAGWRSPLALALSLVMLGTMYFQVIQPARAHPPLHDISTDVQDPPQFSTLTLREDNLVPFDNIEEWRSTHREGYPDIRPAVINKAPNLVLADVRALAEERGWEIANVDTDGGRLEATATAGFVRFFDDVVIEVTPVADGSTRVDMRSVSRVGVSDLGYNAERVETFLNDLRAMN